jgi:hypothetical protein
MRANTTKEGLSTNAKYTYYPGGTESIVFGIDDVVDEAVSIFRFIKTDNGLPDSNQNPPGSSQPNLAISQAYSPIATDYVKHLDLVFADYFDSKKVVGELEKDPIKFETKWKESVKPYSDIYNNMVKYVIDPSSNSKDPFSQYFLLLIDKYKTGGTQLGEIKTFLYNLIKPIFLQSQLIQIYTNNVQRYLNQDGSSNASLIFMVDTCSDFLSKSTIINDFPLNDSCGNVHVLKDDTANMADNTFSIDSIKLFHTIGVLMQFRQLTHILNSNKPPLNTIQTTDSIFVSGFQSYLDKLYPNAPPKSKWIFVLNHLPPIDIPEK